MVSSMKKRVHSLIDLRLDILYCFLSFAENLTVGIVPPSQNIATFKRRSLLNFVTLSSSIKYIQSDIKEWEERPSITVKALLLCGY